MRTVTVYARDPHPGQVLPGVLSANGLPRRGEAVRVLCDGAARLGHVASVDRERQTYSVQLEGALTPRERQVLRLVAEGLTRAQIGEALGIALATVAQHAHHVYAKLGMCGREEAREWVRRLGL